MIDIKQRRLIQTYLNILLRRKKIIVTCVIAALALGMWKYLDSPKIYKCTSLIKYERHRINPSDQAPGYIKDHIKEVVATISRQITSRGSLEKVINDFSLYSGKIGRVPLEDVVAKMREKDIEIGAEGRGEIFHVSYKGKDPEKVQQVTNELAARFIEENVRYRQERASETSAYVEDELEMTWEKLNEKEARMRDYKLKHYNEMPGQLSNNLNRLSDLQDQYQNMQVSIQNMEHTRMMVQEQISQRKEYLAMQSGEAGGGSSLEVIQTEINQLQGRLQNLVLRYTDRHPEVKRAKAKLEKLKESKQEALKAKGEEPPAGNSGAISSSDLGKIPDPQLLQLRQQRDDLEYNIAQLKKDREEVKNLIKKYEKRIDAAPIREAEWAKLTRDYNELQKRYQALKTRGLEAESTLNLEKRIQGSQFKIVDPAYLPQKPFSPDFMAIMLVSTAFGLVIGGLLGVGVEFFSTSFKDPTDLEEYLGVPILCAIPKISLKQEKIRERFISLFWLLSMFGSFLVLVVVFLHYLGQGVIII